MMKSSHLFQLWRCVLADMMYKSADAETMRKIDADVKAYQMKYSDGGRERKGTSGLNGLLLAEDKTFRNVFYYRMRKREKLCTLCKLFLPSVKAVEIYGEIDGGLLLSHYHMVVHPKKAGKNLCVGPGAVLGKNNGQYPTIGDNVSIGANATVIGDITVGDNAVICPGSVVTKSLPGDAVYSGNPAHCVSREDE